MCNGWEKKAFFCKFENASQVKISPLPILSISQLQMNINRISIRPDFKKVSSLAPVSLSCAFVFLPTQSPIPVPALPWISMCRSRWFSDWLHHHRRQDFKRPHRHFLDDFVALQKTDILLKNTIDANEAGKHGLNDDSNIRTVRHTNTTN